MPDHGRPNDNVIVQAVTQMGGHRVNAKALLRKWGFRFTDAWYSKKLADLADDLPPTAREKGVKDADDRPLAGGTIAAPDERRRSLTGKRFVFTAAQNNTYLHRGFWSALQHFCGDTGAELIVSRFTYNKHGWKQHGGISKKDADGGSGLWYDPLIDPYVLDEQVKVCEGLVFCGELDILPTAAMPLNTLQNYTGPNSAVVPHAKVHMSSLATMKHDPARFMYTTGACTLRNYIERKAGQVATFHHVFGALYVEIDEDGDWFTRQLIADDNGFFYDLTTLYGPDGVYRDHGAGQPFVTLGDIHIEHMDPVLLQGALSMLDALNPSRVFLHDLIDFKSRNHHNIKDPYFIAGNATANKRVEHDLISAVLFLGALSKKYPTTHLHVIESNHDQALERWLKDPAGQMDGINARFWHECNAVIHRAIEDGAEYHIFEYVIRDLADKTNVQIPNVEFVHEDSSLVLRDIEHAIHGHRGPNGARGNPKAFRQLGRKANTDHTHTAGIIDGVWTGGLLAKHDLGYNKGPSSWSCSHIITQPNGKRQMITQRGKKWRA
ncbi:hypothetical protein [Pannonibacter sp. SL95]|uniref:hypothetical protein n=1 Tax=Pannonibacter sp. SL95 TaxID=2995153 RepID=UPI002276A6DF|nr:hypothetical protein [Pannonibacter sp. SL95]MCY1708376.1 hypothetical protein [Pannonibacter sp. SL95]